MTEPTLKTVQSFVADFATDSHHIAIDRDGSRWGLRCEDCLWTDEQVWWRSTWHVWNRHIEMLSAFEKKENTLLVASIESPVRKYLTTIWLDNLFSPDPVVYNDHRYMVRRDETIFQSLKDSSRRGYDLVGKEPWTFNTDREGDLWPISVPWIIGVTKDQGFSYSWFESSKPAVMMAIYKLIAKYHDKGYYIKTYDDVSIALHGAPVEPEVVRLETIKPAWNPQTHLAALVEKARKATTTERIVNILSEVDETLETFQILKDTRSDLVRRLNRI